jgi:SAM-dependent methyltransferase
MMSDPRFAPRPPARLDRPPLPKAEIERIRAERREPRWTQWDYLHLDGLRRGLSSTLATYPPTGRVLDVFCGTKPYAYLLDSSSVWGMDLDRHFGGADVVGALPFPFRDRAFGTVMCTQALHLVDDPVATIAEIGRVLSQDGRAIVTIPHLFVGEGDLERHWSPDDLRHLFAGWRDVRVRGIDGPGVALAFVLGRLAMRAARRSRFVAIVYEPSIVLLNLGCALLDRLLRPLHRRWPHTLILVARPPSTEGR